MRFIVIDTETTGTDLERDQVIELGAVAVDTDVHPSEWKEFHTLVRHDRYSGSAYALALNAEILGVLGGRIESDETVTHIDNLGLAFKNWLTSCGYVSLLRDDHSNKITITVGGKNIASFDVLLLKRTNIVDFVIFRHRYLDAISGFTDLNTDAIPPSIELCKERAGLPAVVNHRALDDAWDATYLILSKMTFQPVENLFWIFNKISNR